MDNYYIRKGIVTFGKYYEWDWAEDIYSIIAKASSLEDLEKEVLRLTKENTNNGFKTDNGYRSCVSSIKWEKEIKYISEVII